MGYILLGHGDLNVNPSLTPPAMEIVAIPPGTTIQFFADAGQDLCYSSELLDAWEHLEAPWPRLDSSSVTYNLSLESAWEYWDEELKNDPQLGGHQLVRAGIGDVPDPIRLCTGTPDTCPTDPRQVAEGWTHTCDGVLGRAEFQGEDLYWLACVPMDMADRAVVDAALDGRPRKVVLGDDPDRVLLLDDADLLDLDRVNIATVENAGDGTLLEYGVVGSGIRVGDGHDFKHRKYFAIQADLFQGWLLIERETDAPTSLTFAAVGVPPQVQGSVEAHLGRLFPASTVCFVQHPGETSDGSWSSDARSWASYDSSGDDSSDSWSDESSDEFHLSPRTIHEVNRYVVSNCAGQSLDYCAGGGVFLVGRDHHDDKYVRFAEAQEDFFAGELVVGSDLALRIADVPTWQRLFVEEELLGRLICARVDFR